MSSVKSLALNNMNLLSSKNWKTVKLVDVSLKIKKGTTPTTEGGGYSDEGINFIKAESLTDRFALGQIGKV